MLMSKLCADVIDASTGHSDTADVKLAAPNPSGTFLSAQRGALGLRRGLRDGASNCGPGAFLTASDQ